MILDTDSQVYVTIITHQGLFKHTSLPLTIFQCMKETILQGLTMVQCYIDEILVTGISEQKHLHNLVEVLKLLSEYKIQVKQIINTSVAPI